MKPRKRVRPRRQLGLPVQKIETYQWHNTDSPHIYVPVSPQRQLVNFLIDTEAQISIISSLDAQRTYVKPSQWRVKIIGFTSKSKTCPIAKVNLLLPGQKRISRHQLAVVLGKENVLGFDVLQVWKLLDGSSVWSFGCLECPQLAERKLAATRGRQ